MDGRDLHQVGSRSDDVDYLHGSESGRTERGNPQRPHFPVEIGSPETQYSRCRADATVVVFEYGRNVFALELRARCLQSHSPIERSTTVQMQTRYHVLEGDAARGIRTADDALEQRLEFCDVAWPRKRRKKRQR